MKTSRIVLFINVWALVVAAGCGDDNGCSGGSCGAGGVADSGGVMDAQPGADSGGVADSGGAADARADAEHGGEDAGADAGETLAIVGSYSDEWGTSHEITADSWTQVAQGDSSVFAITQYSNQDHYLIAHNDKANKYNGDLWSRFDWTEKSGSLYYCQTVYDAATEATALAATPADASDLDAGCAGFSWSKLTAK